MKRFTPYLIGALVTLVILAAFSLGQASAAMLASTGCFSDTNGHWAETAICWAASNGVVGGFPDGTYKPNNTVTRAQVAVMLKNQVNIPPETGEHRVHIDPTAWQVNAGSVDTAYILRYTDTAQLRATTTGLKGFQVGVPAPGRVYGRNTVLKGVTLCYSADPNTSLNAVYLQLFANSNGVGTAIASVVDAAIRTDATCRVYNLSSPTVLFSGDHINLFISVNFATTGGIFRVSSATVTFDPYVPLAIGPEPMRTGLPGLDTAAGADPGE